MNGSRWSVVMNHLMYPAVLGTLVYSTLIAITGHGLGFETTLLVVVFLALFTMDYAHSVDENNLKTYTQDKFWWDLTSVVFLLLAGVSIVGNSALTTIHPAWWLVCAKAVDVLRENVGHVKDPWPTRNRIEVETDAAFFVIYLALALCSLEFNFSPLLLAVAVAADAYTYARFNSMVANANRPRSSTRARRRR